MISNIRSFPDDERWQEYIKTTSDSLKGTTTVALCASDGIVLISDSRATMGTLVASKAAIKLFQITKFAGATIAGLVADGQKLVDILKAEAELYNLNRSRIIPIKSLASIASNLLHSSRWFPFIVQTIVGGVDPLRGPQIFSIDPFGSLLQEKRILATGSGSPIALGLLEDIYNEDLENLPSVEEAAQSGIRAISAATRRDIMSGDGFAAAIITKKGYNYLSHTDIINKFG